MRKEIFAGLIVSVLFATVGVLWLSTSMETLDEIAERFGVEGHEIWNPIFPDYSVPGHEESAGATLILSLASTILVFCTAYLVGKLLIVKRGKR
jgi:hypothetical protein